MRASSEGGFSLAELILVLGLTLVVTAVIFELVSQTRRRFEAEPEVADRQQRIRVAVDTLQRDLLTAVLVLPYRAPSDPAGTFKKDVVTLIGERGWNEPPLVRTYYLRRDPASGASQLMRAEGGGGDAPVIDGLASLTFAYFGDSASPAGPAGACKVAPGAGPLTPIVESEFTDGPWCPSAGGGDPFDADLLRIRKIAVRMAIRAVPGEVGFDITPRNRNHGR